jgi:TetR/AcrR family transcriptional regulator, transcriptional repressor for nem operon
MMEMKDLILNSAQRLVQQRGFNGFSYADVAEEVGIRKASLHHHFPSKNDLGVALIRSYCEQFDGELAHIDQSKLKADERLRAYVKLYRNTLHNDCMCLCGMLGTEVTILAESMRPELRGFFVHNTEWLSELLATGKLQKRLRFNGAAADHARLFLSFLQGALMLARATGDLAAFDRSAEIMLSMLSKTV